MTINPPLSETIYYRMFETELSYDRNQRSTMSFVSTIDARI